MFSERTVKKIAINYRSITGLSIEWTDMRVASLHSSNSLQKKQTSVFSQNIKLFFWVSEA